MLPASFSQEVAQSLFSLCKTIQCIPSIYYQKDKPAHAQIIDKFSELQQLYDSANKSEENFFQQPSHCNLIIFDRDIDLGTSLLHPIYYGALIHEIIKIQANKVNLALKDEGKVKEVSLDPLSDQFWFSNINEEITQVMKLNNDKVEQLEKNAKEMNIQQDLNSNDEVISVLLKKFMDKVPQIVQEKEI